MSKTWQTKKRILKLLSGATKTPGEISAELDLAPSTVSEHLEELQKIGAVTQVENKFVRKWKCYRANPNFDVERAAGFGSIGRIRQFGVALAVVLGLLALVIVGLPALSAGNQVAFALTDPPSVPTGTQSLNITYSSLQAHYIAAEGASGWVSGSGSGKLDLLSLINTSQVIGTGKIPLNATVDMVRFEITSAKITINGTVYNVTVPSGRLTSHVTSTSRLGANSSILIDLSPVVTAIYTQNSTVFVLVPSVKAVIVGHAFVTLHVGERHNLNKTEQDDLDTAAPQINITSSSLKVIGNATTQLSVTVKNTGKENVTLMHVMLRGVPAVVVKENVSGGNILIPETEKRMPAFALNSSAGINANVVANVLANVDDTGIGLRDNIHDNITVGATGGQHGNGINIELHQNGTVLAHVPKLSAGDEDKLDTIVKVGASVRSFRVLNFLVESNGTLVLPRVSRGIGAMAECDNCFDQRMGYVLKPGASVTLTFSGSIIYAHGHLLITPVSGSKWRVVVAGTEDARASVNVTAG